MPMQHAMRFAITAGVARDPRKGGPAREPARPGEESSPNPPTDTRAGAD
jgi:hypothetical protein